MAQEVFLSVQMVWPFLAAIRAHGVDPDAVLAPHRLSVGDLLDPNTRVAHDIAMEILDAAILATSVESLGLDAAAWARFVPDDLLDHLALTAPSLPAGTRAYAEYSKLLYPVLETELVVEGDTVRHTYSLAPPHRPPRGAIDFALGLVLVNFERAELPRPPLFEVRFAYPRPSDTEPYERFFRSRLVFGHEENAVVFERAAYEGTPMRSNPKLHHAMRRHFDPLLARVRNDESLEARVRATVETLLPEGSLSEGAIAKMLAMSESSLRHRLKQACTSYTRIVDEVRHRRALELLSDRRRSVKEIAAVLGFSEVSAFSRAFKRWTGRSPAEHRRTIARPCGGRP